MTATCFVASLHKSILVYWEGCFYTNVTSENSFLIFFTFESLPAAHGSVREGNVFSLSVNRGPWSGAMSSNGRSGSGVRSGAWSGAKSGGRPWSEVWQGAGGRARGGRDPSPRSRGGSLGGFPSPRSAPPP